MASDISLADQLLNEARRSGQLLAFAPQESDDSSDVEESEVETPPVETSTAEEPTEANDSSDPAIDDSPDEGPAEPDTATQTGTEAAPNDPLSDSNSTTPDTSPNADEVDHESATDPDDPLGLGSSTTGVQELNYQSKSNVQFATQKVTKLALEEQIAAAAETLGITKPQVDITNSEWDGVGEPAFDQWDVKFTCGTVQAGEILEEIKSEFESRPFLLSSSTIGGAVADKAKGMAIAALLTSLIGIVGYIWIRFQRVTYGLAAVIALLHDVTITIGAVALSYWLANVLGFLMVDEFKISLPVVAALLTIVGYSLNDTIVVFDRIREVKGKSPELTEEMVNTSINQTLSRTILTSSTTLIVVLILYIFGGQGIHGFAFSLLVGVIVGTYSSIFVASPALLWMSRLGSQQPAPSQKVAA